MRAAPSHPVAAALRRRKQFRPARIGRVRVQAPLLDIAMHVIKPEGIGSGARPHRQVHGAEDVVVVNAFVIELQQPFRQRVSIAEGGRRARTAGIFPFDLRGQAPVPARPLGQPAAIGHRVLPGYEDHCLVVTVGETVAPPYRVVRRIEALILGVGHFRHAHPERTVDRDRMDRTFVAVELTPFVADAPCRLHGQFHGFGSHLETAGRHLHGRRHQQLQQQPDGQQSGHPQRLSRGLGAASFAR